MGNTAETERDDIPNAFIELAEVLQSLIAGQRRDVLHGFCLYFILQGSMGCLKSFWRACQTAKKSVIKSVVASL